MLRAAALLALLAAQAAGPAAAQFLITESDAARYPQGAVMAPDARVSLAPGERLAFIGPDGVVRVVVGRFEGALADGEAVARNRRDFRRGRDDAGRTVAGPAATGRGARGGAIAAAPDLPPSGLGADPGGAPGLPGPDPADR